jgi:hypothetical protein
VNILDNYVHTAPDAQTTIDIFKGEWSSILPASLGVESGGGSGVFDDARIHWLLNRLGNVAGRTVIELGPLEGGHTYMLEQAGAVVTAVESNTRAYLKCLIVKELLSMKDSRFLLGDFIEYLKSDQTPFDIALASGVIYHMRNPAALIELLAQRSADVFVWTHYYCPEQVRNKPHFGRTFAQPEPAEHAGFKHRVARKYYGEALDWSGFCGGSADYACWMPREDLFACFEHFGMEIQAVEFDHPDHPNGPALAFHARRAG